MRVHSHGKSCFALAQGILRARAFRDVDHRHHKHRVRAAPLQSTDLLQYAQLSPVAADLHQLCVPIGVVLGGREDAGGDQIALMTADRFIRGPAVKIDAALRPVQDLAVEIGERDRRGIERRSQFLHRRTFPNHHVHAPEQQAADDQHGEAKA